MKMAARASTRTRHAGASAAQIYLSFREEVASWGTRQKSLAKESFRLEMQALFGMRRGYRSLLVPLLRRRSAGNVTQYAVDMSTLGADSAHSNQYDGQPRNAHGADAGIRRCCCETQLWSGHGGCIRRGGRRGEICANPRVSLAGAITWCTCWHGTC